MQAQKDFEVQVRQVLDEIARDPVRMSAVVSSPQIELAEEVCTALFWRSLCSLLDSFLLPAD